MTRLICLTAGSVLGGEVNTSKFSDRLAREKPMQKRLTQTAGKPILLLLLAVSVHLSFWIEENVGGLIVNWNRKIWGSKQGAKSSKMR